MPELLLLNVLLAAALLGAFADRPSESPPGVGPDRSPTIAHGGSGD